KAGTRGLRRFGSHGIAFRTVALLVVLSLKPFVLMPLAFEAGQLAAPVTPFEVLGDVGQPVGLQGDGKGAGVVLEEIEHAEDGVEEAEPGFTADVDIAEDQMLFAMAVKAEGE